MCTTTYRGIGGYIGSIYIPIDLHFYHIPPRQARFDILYQCAILMRSSNPIKNNCKDGNAIMGRPKGSKNKPQTVAQNSIGLGGSVAPVSEAPAKIQGVNTIGKLNREIVLRFAPGTLTARNSANGNLTTGGRGIDQNGIVWNITTAMPLNPATGKSCPTESVNMVEFLNGVSPE